MTATFEFKRLARGLGIVAIFTIVGPIVVTTMFGLIFLWIGVPMVQILLEFFKLESLREWLSVTVFLLVFFSLAGAVLPSVLAGLAFAIASVYCGKSSLWVELIIVGIMVIGVVALSLFVSPSESSPLVLPSVEDVRQGGYLALFLSIPAAIAASLCWLFSRPLHRLS